LAAGTVDAVPVALLGRRREWVRQQGRANAALLLLARELTAEFLPPAKETDFGAVQGRARGCAFVLRVSESRDQPTPILRLTLRHYSKETTLGLQGPGCTVPDLDPALLREAIEQACHSFAVDH
jgi:hypothetical protein